jgi:hypothetical protein
MLRCSAGPAVVGLCAVVLIGSTSTPASAHDSWISRGGLRNGAGEWCCGEGDCFIVPPKNVSTGVGGYTLFGQETVPYAETQPSPDGEYWRCKRPDGSRRCFFAPPVMD